MRTRRRGQSLVESSLALIAFLTMALTIIDAGRLFLARTAASGQLREVARWASIHPDSDEAIRTQARRAGFTTVTITRQGPGLPDERITIEAETPHSGQITPWFDAGPMRFTASALVER